MIGLLSEHIDGRLIFTQEKTKQTLRIQIIGELATLLARIEVRKAACKFKTAALLVNVDGKRLTGPVLRTQFHKVRDGVIAKLPDLKKDVKNFRFYNFHARRLTI